MNTDLLELLRCPRSGQTLSLAISSGKQNDEHPDDSSLVSADGVHSYPIHNGIPRFVPPSNYAANFGMQWNRFRHTQLDSHSGVNLSSDRFWRATGWSVEDLKGRWVLDVGCGAGRFAEVALNAGANVVALDYSSAVDACYANLKHHRNLHVIQGDIFALPFRPDVFDFVYSLGVLQHTPDVGRAFAALPVVLRPGGSLCVDYYEYSWRSFVQPKYWLRPLTTRMPQAALFRLLQRSVPSMLLLSRAIGAIPAVGRTLRRVVPVVNYYGVYPLTHRQQLEWSLLDTFDWFAPKYDNPQTASTARRWMEDAGMSQIEVINAGHLVARARKVP